MDDLQALIMRNLQEYADEVKEKVNTVTEDVAKVYTKELKKTSPKAKGDYKKGWAKKTQSKGNGIKKIIIYNKTEYQLTHLLEKGHAKRGGGRVRAIPHIAPIEEQAADAFESQVMEELSR